MSKLTSGNGRHRSVLSNVALAAILLPFVAHDLSLTVHSLGVYLFLGFFQIGLAYVLFIRGLEHVTATQASLTGMLEPVMNPVWVFLFLGERPSLSMIPSKASRLIE